MPIRFFLLALACALAAPAALAQGHGGMHHGDGMHADSAMHAGMHQVLHGRGAEQARVSPNAFVGQTIGTTNIVLSYGRPSVRDRVIFGELVPYGEVWRTGANEATAVYFSKDVTIGGQRLPAGAYSLHTIPGEGRWTVIFNRAVQQWGSYEYDDTQDALRVEVTPGTGPRTEMMTFAFEDVTEDAGTLVLYWDEVRVPIAITAP